MLKKNSQGLAQLIKLMKIKFFIRPDKVIKGDAYASFVYVVMHELGHRYLRKIQCKNGTMILLSGLQQNIQ